MVYHPPGQFYHGINYEVAHLHPGKVPEKPDATMYVKGQELNVTRYTKDFSLEVFACKMNFKCVVAMFVLSQCESSK